jgi:hypothetical protein
VSYWVSVMRGLGGLGMRAAELMPITTIHSPPPPGQALSSPLSGILGEKFDRTRIVAFGCLLWGVMTSVIGACSTLSQVREGSV